MSNVIVYQTCPKCKGTGIAQVQSAGGLVEENPCKMCDGESGLATGYVNMSDFDAKLNDILDKCNDIFEQVSEP